VQVKSAILAVFIVLLIAADGCSKNKKPEEAPATTQTQSNTTTTGAGTSTAASPQNTPAPAEEPGQPPAANKGMVSKPETSESAKPPAVKKHVVNKSVTSEASAEPSSGKESSVPKPVTLPEGTVLTVRLNESLSSKSNHAGDKFTATIEEPVKVGGKIVIPKGSSVSGTVTDAKARGKLKGSATLRLVLDSVSVKDRNYVIQTTAVAHSMEGKGKRTAVLGGGGAGTGALVGALAGGAKGFGIGMVVGAGVGLAGGAFTGNKNIELPAETMLSFKLLNPVDVKR